MSDDTSLTDRVLDLIDNGLQSSHEPSIRHRPELCPRCQHHESAEGGDMCAGCRAWMLEDSDDDPANPEPEDEHPGVWGEPSWGDPRQWPTVACDPAGNGNHVIIIDDLRGWERVQSEDAVHLRAEMCAWFASYNRTGFPDISTNT